MEVSELFQKWPVFGKSPQTESQYQSEINIIANFVSEIITHIIDIEAELAILVADVAYLNANAVTAFDVQSTYDSMLCPGMPVVDLFDPPTVTPNVPHGQSVVFNSRPLVSTDNSVLISYDAICGVVNLQTSCPPDPVSIASAGGSVSLVNGSGLGPNMFIKGLSAADANIGLTDNGTDIIISNNAPDQIVSLASGTGISVTGAYPSFTITNSAPDQTVSLTSGAGISISGPYPNFTISKIAPLYATYQFDAGTAVLPGAASRVTFTNNDAILRYSNTADFTITAAPSRIQYVGVSTKVFLFNYSGGIAITAGGSARATFRVIQNATPVECATRISSTGTNDISCYSGSTVVTLATNDTLEFAVDAVVAVAGGFPYTFAISNANSSSLVELL